MIIVVTWRRNLKAITGIEVQVVKCDDLSRAVEIQDKFIIMGWDGARIEQSQYMSPIPDFE